MKTAKEIRKNSEVYGKTLTAAGVECTEQSIVSYEKRLREMYDSDNFRKHNIYPTTNTTSIYAVIAMCLELKDKGLSDEQIIYAGLLLCAALGTSL